MADPSTKEKGKETGMGGRREDAQSGGALGEPEPTRGGRR